MNSNQVYASKWPSETNSQVLWTLVNIAASAVNGSQLVIPYQAGMVYYDLWHGVELKPVVNNGTAVLAFSIEGNGYGVILGTKPSDRPRNLTAFLATMRKLTAQPLSSYSAANTVLTQTINPNLTTKPYSEPPTGMVTVTGGTFQFTVEVGQSLPRSGYTE